MKVFTIGFAKKNAELFFSRLKQPELVRVVDIRLKNASQLAGFTKKDDLPFFLRQINGLDYVHCPDLAPTEEILDGYKKNGGDWSNYESRFIALMKERKIDETVPKELIDGGCLLCSEASPERCHRRLVAEYLLSRWGALEIVHL